MSVPLKSNFFKNARSLTFQDGNGVSWSLNPNTNALMAAVSGANGGTVTSVGLNDGSTAPIYAISGSPVAAAGTLTFTLKTQSANFIFAGPGSGAAAQPGFRALVVADLPSGYQYSNLTGAPSIPSGANPTASAGLTVVNGSAPTFMRSDAAPAISQAITPTWTGKHVFQPSGSFTAIQVTAAVGNYGVSINGGTNDAARLGLIDGNTGNEAYQVRSGGLAVGVFDVFDATAGVSRFSITKTGAVTIPGTFAVNNGTPAAQLTGFGSPAGTVTSGLNSSSTLTQVAGTLAALLAYLKTIGFIGT